MKTEDVLSLLDGSIQKTAETGITSVELSDLQERVHQLREMHQEDERLGFDAVRLERHRAELAALAEGEKQKHEWSLEMFRSVLEAGLNAVKSCILINGGAAVALMAFLGHTLSQQVAILSVRQVAGAMMSFVGGVFAGAFTSGMRYVSQMLYADGRRKAAIAFHVVAIMGGLASLGLFGWGAWLFYEAITKA